MILGSPAHKGIFEEVDGAVANLMAARKDPRIVCFNAHAAPHEMPAGAIAYNLENVGIQISADIFAGRTIWDFSARNVSRWRAAGRNAVHVPVAYHGAFTRFSPRRYAERDIDVAFVGDMNARRQHILAALRSRGLRVEHVFGLFGPARDSIFSRAKIAINMRYYADGAYPILRYLHAAANQIPIISETSPEVPSWVSPAPVSYEALPDRIAFHIAQGQQSLESLARTALQLLQTHPMALPV